MRLGLPGEIRSDELVLKVKEIAGVGQISTVL